MTILVGTMTGTAELVAAEVETVLAAAGYAPRTLSMEQADATVFADGGLFLIVCSTYGNGDVPDNAQAFFADLATSRPALGGAVYGLVALGDMTYKATFCNGGRQFDDLLTKLGATGVGEPLLHDASSGTLAEDVACAWAENWIAQDMTRARAA